MSMPLPPPDTRSPGQSGHIADHNTIADALTALESAVGGLQQPGSPLTGMATTPLKTGSYTALPWQLVPADASAGNVTITLPATPADGTQVAVKMVKTAGLNQVTVQASGSATFNATGTTSFALTMLNQAVLVLYSAGLNVWYVVSDDLPLLQLDTRYVAQSVMTALGDTIYGGASGVAARVPGNTTATRKFLRQLGTGSASAAPAWDTIQAGDLPVSLAGLTPTNADDTANMQNLLNLTGVLPLQAGGQYIISAPLVLPQNALITGGGSSVTGTAATSKSCINAKSTFSGHSMLYAADAGSNPWAGPTLRHVAVDGANLPAFSYSFTATNASPAVFTAAGNALVNGQLVTLSGASLPGGFTAGTSYFVVNASGSTFQLANNPGDTAINSTSTGSGTVVGVVDAYRAYGWVHGTNMDDVSFANVTGWGINSTYKPSNGGLPSAYWAHRLLVNLCYSGGINLAFASDSDFIDVYQIGSNGGPGWRIQSVDNSHFTNCRSEWNAGHGWWITGGWYQVNQGSTTTFVGCTTDRNALDGLHVDATGNTPLVFSGCTFRRDGRNGGSGGGNYAGVAFAGTTLKLIFDGLVVTPGVDDNGGGTLSPQYGLSSNGSANVAVNSGWIQGATGTTTGNSAYALYSSPAVTLATGPVSGPTIAAAFGTQSSLKLLGTNGVFGTSGGSSIYQPYATTTPLTIIAPSGLTGNVPITVAAGSATVANSVAATAIATASINSGDTQTDAVYRIRAWGLASTTGTPTLTFALAWGATTLIATAAVAMGNGVANQQVELEAELHFTAAGTVAARMKGLVSTAANGWNTPAEYLQQAPATAVTVNSAQALQITAQWSAASASNTLTTRYTVERIN